MHVDNGPREKRAELACFMWHRLPFHPTEPVTSKMAKTTLVTPALKEGTVYEDWKLEVEAWQELTELAKTKQGLMLVLAISESHPMGLKHSWC